VLRRVGLAAATFAALFVAVAEVVFFDEFDGRFNFVAVDYLIYPTEVVTNLWQSYPVAWVLAGAAAAAVVLVRLLRRPLARLDAAAGPARRGRAVVAMAYAGALAALSVAVSPSLARVSAARDVNELAANGYYTFWQALRGQDAPYDGLYATRPDSVVLPELRRLVVGPAGRGATAGEPVGSGTARRVAAAGPARRLNVVVVLEESLGAEFVGALHPRDTASLTPRFDSLAAEGTLLTHAYSTGNRTIRALEATTASLPPLPGISVVRRPQSVDLFTLPALLRDRGYATTFVYGGRALFDGMGAYMRHNGIERVIEQRDYPAGTFHTAWGVADEAIFDRALVELDSLHATGRPFYALVLSVSNHKPYTYPAGRIVAEPAARRRDHAVAYADWALGRFVRQARSHAFFDSTVFVLMGDHGPRVYGAAEIPLPSYEVPVLLYAPGIVPAGRRVPTLASSLDVPPTVLGLLGGAYDSKFFGRDVLHDDPAGGRALMTHNAEIALLRGDRLAVLGPRGLARVFVVDSAGGTTPVATTSPADTALVEEAIAYYEGADHLYRRGDYRFAAAPAADRLARW
jgi:phosphoglycerol transferase MdoB-like AlkP superfamily enzyme